jgi:hypothetical protein
VAVKKISSDDAQKFHSASRHGTFFSRPQILEKIFDSVDWWGYFQGREIACAWPIALDQNKVPIRNYYFTYYVGPMWAFKLPEYPAHKSLSLTNNVYNSFLDIFAQNYSEITYTFPTGLHDIRPFIWRSQNNHEERHNIEIKYTAKIDLTSMDLMLKDFRQVRRWELKNSILTGLEIVYDDFEVKDILKFYSENIPLDNFQQQQPAESNQILYKYLNLKASVGLRSIKVYESSSGQTVAFVLLGIHEGIVNIIINNVSKKYKQNKSYLTTYLNHLIIKKFLEEGNLSIDFNGANSPVLADNKHSFGARAYSYFKINSRFRFAQ